MNCTECTIFSIFTINGLCLVCFDVQWKKLKAILNDAPTAKEMQDVLK